MVNRTNTQQDWEFLFRGTRSVKQGTVAECHKTKLQYINVVKDISLEKQILHISAARFYQTLIRDEVT